MEATDTHVKSALAACSETSGPVTRVEIYTRRGDSLKVECPPSEVPQVFKWLRDVLILCAFCILMSVVAIVILHKQ